MEWEVIPLNDGIAIVSHNNFVYQKIWHTPCSIQMPRSISK